MSGKGSGRRPAQVNEQAFSDSWDSIFGKKDKEQDQPEEAQPELNEKAARILQRWSNSKFANSTIN